MEERKNVIWAARLLDTKSGGKIFYAKRNGLCSLQIPENYNKIGFYIKEEDELKRLLERIEDEEKSCQTEDGKMPVKLIDLINLFVPLEVDIELIKKIEQNKKKEKEGLERIGYQKKENEVVDQLGNLDSMDITFDVEKPMLFYEDVTDKHMFGFPAIQQGVLTSTNGGLWAYHGEREFHLTIKKLLEEVKDDKLKALPKLYFIKKDAKEIKIQEMADFELAKKSIVDFEDKSYEYKVMIDTDRLGEQLDDAEQAALFSGYFELTFCWTDNLTTKYPDICYCIPIELNINNTKYVGDGSSCIALQDETVSIDFGTSSSCVAVEGENGIELLTISSDEKIAEDCQTNFYENPTYIMLYRWESVYEQWKKENDGYPLLTRGNRMDEFNNSDNSVQYDFGYSVKQSMDAVDQDELNAILTELKMIPSVLHDGRQLKVKPFIKGRTNVIALASSPEEEDAQHFDPVAFYAYILGRAINRVSKNKIYTKFDITYPVKFEAKLREKLRRSLEYGLKRSLPLKLRDAKDKSGQAIFRVEMNNAEPVAYIGAVCSKYLKLKGDKPELFAVFDFGGGTLDYSFGFFTKDPDDPGGGIIYILQVDGDSKIGGETLIKRMSYWIYVSDANKERMIKNDIPFEMPEREIIPNGFPERLFNESMEAKANVRKVNEKISRKIFEESFSGGNAGDSDAGSEQIELMSQNGDEGAGIPLEINYDKQNLNEQLEKVLKEKVEQFRLIMNETFRKHSRLIKSCGGEKYDVSQVHIFKAGNSSKNHVLNRLMNEQFGEEHVWLVDETDAEFMMQNAKGEVRKNKVAITPKTAVAIGQVNLQKFDIKDLYRINEVIDAPFAWYVVVINAADNSVTVKIAKASANAGWVKYCKINAKRNVKIYYSSTRVKDGSSDDIRSKNILLDQNDAKGKMLYLRVVDTNRVEYRVCVPDEQPDQKEEPDEQKIVSLK